MRYTKSDLLEILQECTDMLGRPPTADEYKAMVNTPSIGVFQYMFRSSPKKHDGWSNAIQMLGYAPRKKRIESNAVCEECGKVRTNEIFTRLHGRILCPKCYTNIKRGLDNV